MKTDNQVIIDSGEQTDVAAVQTRLDAVVIQAFQDPASFAISPAEREVLRRLAGEVASIADRLIEAKRVISGTGTMPWNRPVR